MMKETKFKDTEIGVIPDDWEVAKLGDLGELAMCKRIFQHETSDTGEVPFYKIGTFGKIADAYITNAKYNEFKSAYRFPNKGDLLISAAGTIGRIVVYDGKPAYFQDSNIVWLAHNGKKVKNRFLYYLYQITDWNTENTTIARLYNDNFNKTIIPIPPIDEQRRIASALTSIDNLISSLDKLIEKKKNIKQGAMQQLLTGKKRLKGFNEPWIEKRLGDCALIQRGGSPRPIEDFITESQDGVNWIKIGDVTPNDKYLRHTDEKITKEGVVRSRYVHKGDFILSNSMSFGRPYILDIDGCIHDGWLVIQEYQDIYDMQFLYYLLCSDEIKIQYIEMVTGSSVKNLNKEKVANVLLSSPVSLVEQRAIASLLSSMDKEITSLETKKSKYERIKQGMMQQLLTGKIRLTDAQHHAKEYSAPINDNYCFAAEPFD